MDHALIGGYVNAAVFFRSGKTEYMIIFVDGAAHGTQGVVAVGQGIGNRKFLHAGCPGLLDDADIGDVVGHHGVETDLQPLRISGDIMGLQNFICHCVFAGFFRTQRRLVAGDAVYQKDAVVTQFNHENSSRSGPGSCAALLCCAGAVRFPFNITQPHAREKFFS